MTDINDRPLLARWCCTCRHYTVRPDDHGGHDLDPPNDLSDR